MSKRYRSKPVPGVADWEKMNRTGESVEQYYSRTSDSDSYCGTYHQLATKYDWPHEPAKELPPGASRRFSEILKQGVESLPPILIGDWHITINRYGKDDSKVQVLICNLRTEHTASGTMPMSEIDQFIAENVK